MEKRRAARKSGNELLYGRHCVEEALKARRREFLRLWVRRGPLRSESESALALAAQVGLKPISVDSDKMSKIIGLEDSSRPEIALEAGPIPCWNSTGELCRVLASEPGKRRIVALDGVEDPQNVGSIARVANAAGAEGLLLTRRRSSPLSPAVSRASAGAIEWQKTARVANLVRGLDELKALGFWVLAADPGAEQNLYELPDRLLVGDLVIVLGAEGKGLRPSVRAAVDHRLRIPMLGDVGSLNVSAAGAVLLYELVRRRAGAGGPVDTGSPPLGGR